MPTTVSDQFYTFDPASPPPVGTAVNFTTMTLTDQNDDGDVDSFNGDSVGGSDVTRSWPGDTVTINVPGQGLVTYTGTTFYLANGGRVFTPTDGQVLQAGTFVSSTFVTSQGPLLLSNLGPPCFLVGTLIETPGGMVAVEDLRPGDMVLTRDNGVRPICWVGRRRVDGTGAFAPVHIAPGALGNTRSLRVSPQHRILVTGWQAELFLGIEEALVPAIHLVDGDRIQQEPCAVADYVHLMFDSHEIVFSDGVPSESFNPGTWMLEEDGAMRDELTQLFPELGTTDCAGVFPLARPVPRSAEARALARATAP